MLITFRLCSRDPGSDIKNCTFHYSAILEIKLKDKFLVNGNFWLLLQEKTRNKSHKLSAVLGSKHNQLELPNKSFPTEVIIDLLPRFCL